MNQLIIAFCLAFFGLSMSSFTTATRSVYRFDNESELAQLVGIYMKNTRFPIEAANKYHIASGAATMPLDLTNAMKLRDYSKLLFDAGDYEQALICSSKSRFLALKALKAFTNEEHAKKYATAADENAEYVHVTLAADQSTVEQWLERVKLN